MSTMTVTRLDKQLTDAAEELKTNPDAVAAQVVSQHRDYHRGLVTFSEQLAAATQTAKKVVAAREELTTRLQHAENLGVDFTQVEDGKIGGVPVTQFAHVNGHEATSAVETLRNSRSFTDADGQRALEQATGYLKILAEGPKAPTARGEENSQASGPSLN